MDSTANCARRSAIVINTYLTHITDLPLMHSN